MSAYEPGDTMVEELRRANPVPAEQTAGRRSLPSAHALYAEVVAQRPRRVRRRVLVIAIVIILIALVIAAFTIVRRSSAPHPLSTACYSAADLNAKKFVSPSVGDPAQACARVWADGRFGRVPMPHFDVCVLKSGAPAVFPGESGSVCARLHLPSAAGGDNTVDGFVEAANRDVSEVCIGPNPAAKLIQRDLDQRRMKGWTIKRGTATFDAAHPCSSLAFDTLKKTVTIVAWPNPFVPPPTTGP